MGKTLRRGAARDGRAAAAARPTIRRRSPCCGSRRCARSRATPGSRWPRPPGRSHRTGPWTCARATRATPTRARQARRLPTVLVTTPESLSLFLSRADWRERFAHLEALVVDEWHELLSSKRGVQVELARARLARPAPRPCASGACRPRSPTSTDAAAALRGSRPRRRGPHRPRTRGEADRHRHARPGDDRALPVGRAHRRAPAAGGRARDRVGAFDAGLHQRAVERGDLVPGAARGAAALGRVDRAPPRLARARGARVGRAGAARGSAARGRVHVEPRPRRRLRARRPGAADRQSQGRRPAAAARRTQRPPPRRSLARHRAADARARAGRGRRRAGCRRGRRGRGARARRRAARRPRPAPRHLRARRRLRPRRAARRRCAARARTRASPTPTGASRSTSSCTAARASMRIPSTAGW